MDTQSVEWIARQLGRDPRLRSLSPSARADAVGDIIATIYLRKIQKGSRISSGYVAKTARFHLKSPRRGDPYVEKVRRLADERQRKGLPIEASRSRTDPQ